MDASERESGGASRLARRAAWGILWLWIAALVLVAIALPFDGRLLEYIRPIALARWITAWWWLATMVATVVTAVLALVHALCWAKPLRVKVGWVALVLVVQILAAPIYCAWFLWRSARHSKIASRGQQQIAEQDSRDERN